MILTLPLVSLDDLAQLSDSEFWDYWNITGKMLKHRLFPPKPMITIDTENQADIEALEQASMG